MSAKEILRLIDPAQFCRQRVSVFGGGDSALEAAAALIEQPDTQVSLAYRSGAFTRAKKKKPGARGCIATAGRLDLRLGFNVKAIENEHVLIERDGQVSTLENDVVIVCAGGVLPTDFLRETGIGIETHHGIIQDRVSAPA